MKTFDPSTHRAKKRFGQNFLQDQGVIDRIVSCVRAKKDDNIIEIGPGLGAITKQILPVVGQMNVIELDRELIPKLKFNCDGLGQLTINQEDALGVDYNRFADAGPMRIVGNLPYNISTPLLFHLFGFLDKIKDMHFMLQKEVVLRMTAQPGSKTYGRLSVMTQSVCDLRMLFLVPPESFIPAPKVDSAIVYLAPRKHPVTIHDRPLFGQLVSEAFNQRRKTLRNVWRNRIEVERLESLDIDPKLRPEQLSLEDFVRVANHLAEN
ncbi:MAG: 16S rRNA (adenine(1518)-N(6)/adenine(1519)-N(6))-dimethyltransferase RsmA [Enterobacterales bacterium]|nr:16S rRNA (adenine(1518)-N(6)/adenine(1519)-N(6))-dimethyltransferase RsmA [Enterobacterales bacterium]